MNPINVILLRAGGIFIFFLGVINSLQSGGVIFLSKMIIGIIFITLSFENYLNKQMVKRNE